MSLAAPRYALRAIGSPLCVFLMMTAACASLVLHAPVGAVVLALLVAAGAGAVSGLECVRNSLDRATARRARERRVIRLLLSASEPRCAQYFALRRLVENVESWSGVVIQHDVLQDLLDRFAALAGREAARLAIGDGQTSGRAARAIRERRHAEAARIADDLEAIDELVRLVAERYVFDAVREAPTDDLAWRVAELEATSTSSEPAQAAAS